MRKINKQCDLSTRYRDWVTAQGNTHGEYTSSNGDYYWDIVMNLFKCQDGLCAYTETILCNPKYYSNNNWREGLYVNPDAPSRPQIFGQLEHFDKKLKKTQCWLWDNLFMVSSDINTRVKLRKNIDSILKPDSAAYNPFSLMEYSKITNMFSAKSTLSQQEQKRINEMIYSLGMNFDPIKYKREKLFKEKTKLIELGVFTWKNCTVVEFLTAFKMLKEIETGEVAE